MQPLFSYVKFRAKMAEHLNENAINATNCSVKSRMTTRDIERKQEVLRVVLIGTFNVILFALGVFSL